ncbi:hypothetical protein D3C72_1082610 [compost metagenome]
MVAHPFQRCDLIQQGLVAQGLVGGGFRRQGRVGEEAELAQAIVDADQHHPVAGEGRAVIEGQGARPHAVRSAVQPDHDRRRSGRLGGRPDIQRQAVFAGRFRRAADGDDVGHIGGAGLRGGRTERRRFAHAVPGRKRQRRLPAQVADRGGGVGHAAKHVRRSFATPAQVAGRRVRDRRGRSQIDLIHNSVP